MTIFNALNKLKTNLFGGPGNTGFSKPPPSKVQDIGMTPTAVLNNDPLRFGTYQFPKDVFENDQLGHYMVFYVNEMKRSKFDYGAPNAVGVDKFDNPIFANGTGLISEQRRLDGKRYQTTGRSTSSDGENLQFSDRNRRLKTGIDSKRQTTKRISDSIALYLPPSVRDTTTAEYENMATGVIGQFAGKGLDFSKAFNEKDFDAASKELGGAATDFAIEAARRSGAAFVEALAGSEGAIQLLNRTLGQADNPFMEVLFSTMGVREFTYNFNFAPRNSDETMEVQQIIQLFRFHMAPEMQGANARYLTLPSEFDIHYMFKGKNGNGKENDYFNRIATCVCTNVDVNYTPNGVRSFEDGSPTQIQMGLTFRETEILTKEKINQGY
jgi:hypothetical protein